MFIMQTRLAFSRTLRSLQMFPNGYRYCSSGTELSGFTKEELQRLKSSARKIGSQLHLPAPEELAPRGVSGKRPITLLVGWAASNLKVVGKYSTIYTKLGIPCLCVAPGILKIWSTKFGNAFTQNILHALDTSLKKPCSLVLHICSGGGTAIFPTFTEQHSDSSSLIWTKTHPACVIFDSGPSNFSYESGTAAAKLMYKQGAYNLFTYSIASGVGILTNRLVGTRKRSELSSALESGLLDMPQLYLHSAVDTVSPPSWVKAIVDKQVEKGRDVSSHCWPDSEHVRHYLRHPDQYEREVVSFLKKCQLVL